MAREIAPGQFAPTPDEPLTPPPLGMMLRRRWRSPARPASSSARPGFPVDAGLLETARRVAGSVTLKRLVVGGTGGFGPGVRRQRRPAGLARERLLRPGGRSGERRRGAVAYANDVPFIAFRSLSDLAGGDPGPNQARTFFQLAADNSATLARAFLAAAP